MNDEPVAWNYNGPNNAPNTITFNNVNSDWVMQITADKKIIVNEDIEVSDAAQAVLDALQLLLLKAHPANLTDEEILEVFESPFHPNTTGKINDEVIAFARAILKKAQEK